MQYGEAGRTTKTGLTTVCFRLEGTMELLWKAQMNTVPQLDHTCFRFVEDVETEYKVEAVRWEFIHDNMAPPTGYILGVPQYGEFEPTVGTHAAAVVIVSVV